MQRLSTRLMSAPHTHRAPERTPPWTQLSARPSRSTPVVDISTHGGKSSATRRIEIRLWHADGRIFLSGRPGKRFWYANLRANPQLTLHVKRGAESDVEMTARPITDTGERREVLSRIASPNELDAWIEGSPLVELTDV